jgi:hypothetical protein
MACHWLTILPACLVSPAQDRVYTSCRVASSLDGLFAMRNARIVTVMLTSLVALPDLATADIKPSPEKRKSIFADMIKGAGHQCSSVTSFDWMTGARAEEYEKKGLTPATVTCSNGRRYVVATPPRARRNPPADAPPRPAPIIRPLR